MRKIKIYVTLAILFMLVLMPVPSTADVNIEGRSKKAYTCDTVDGDYEYKIAKMTISPGDFPWYKPKLSIKWYIESGERFVAPHSPKKIKFIVEWKIANDAAPWPDEVWKFSFKLVCRDKSIYHLINYVIGTDKYERHDRIGVEDGGSGKLEIAFCPRDKVPWIFDYGNQTSAMVYAVLSMKYERGGKKWTKDSDAVGMEIYLENAPPSKPILSGPRTLEPDEVGVFKAYSTDPEGDTIQYQFKFGDHVTKWSGPRASGEEIVMTYSWDSYYKGKTISVKVRARDTYTPCKVTEWTEIKVKITKNKDIQVSQRTSRMRQANKPIIPMRSFHPSENLLIHAILKHFHRSMMTKDVIISHLPPFTDYNQESSGGYKRANYHEKSSLG